MSNVEHYFENLLFHGHDIKGEPNKNALSKEVQDAVEQCVNYIKYTYYRRDERKTGKWVLAEMGDMDEYKCSLCGNRKTCTPPFCEICGAEMEVEE